MIFEDDDALIVCKAAGRSFHADMALGDPGILRELRTLQAEGALTYRGELLSVHRLDTATSGLLVLAKSAASQTALAREFEERRVSKYYIGLTDREPSKKEGRVVGDMERARRGCYKLLRSTANPAVTRFASRALPPDRSAPSRLRLLLMMPETGKTHQLRVAMKSLGAPLLGDARYARAAQASDVDRCYLHATAIHLHLPGRPAPIAALCAPAGGALFASEELGRIWRQLFPADLLLGPAGASARSEGRGGSTTSAVSAAGADGVGDRSGVDGNTPANPWSWASARRRLRGALAEGRRSQSSD